MRHWSTRDPLADSFAAEWARRIGRAPHAHYALRLDHLAREADHGRHARAVLVDDPCALVVQREEPAGWVSGWPWRSQIAIVDPAGRVPEGITADEQRCVIAALDSIPGAGRSRCFVTRPVAGDLGFPIGATYVHDLRGAGEKDLMARLDGNRRRAIKRARREGYEVVEATTHEQFRGFAVLQIEAERRRHGHPAPVPDRIDVPGEGWREWELPWMWLLVAMREGRVEAGSGFGFVPGGTVDYRANASSAAARHAGVNVLLAWEALRRWRERGATWLNWGGSTEFKRHLGGVRVPIWCRLGGGPAWVVPNFVTASWYRVRPGLAGVWHTLHRRVPHA